MSTHVPAHADTDPVGVVPTPPATGVGAVDRALARLDGIEDLPVADRVAGFEAAHGALRSALDPGADGEDDHDDTVEGTDHGADGGAPGAEPA